MTNTFIDANYIEVGPGGSGGASIPGAGGKGAPGGKGASHCLSQIGRGGDGGPGRDGGHGYPGGAGAGGPSIGVLTVGDNATTTVTPNNMIKEGDINHIPLSGDATCRHKNVGFYQEIVTDNDIPGLRALLP